MTGADAGAAPGGPSIDEVIANVEAGLNDAQQFLANITQQVDGAGAGGTSTGGAGSSVQSVLKGITGATSNLSDAANLSRALPLLVFILGVLFGKPVYGLVGAVVLYAYTHQKPTATS